MKKLLTILCLIVVSSLSFSETIQQHQLVEKDGLVYKRGSTQPFTGSVLDVYDNSLIMGTGTYKDGKRDGMWFSFWKNGNIQYEGVFKDGKEHGFFESFYENGQLKERKTYKDGKEEGLVEQFYENGQLDYKGNWKDGMEDGFYEIFYENGQLDHRGNFKDGKKHGLVEIHYENGQIEERGKYKNGEQDGLWEWFDKNGQLEYRGNYKNGEQEGLHETFRDDGQYERRTINGNYSYEDHGYYVFETSEGEYYLDLYEVFDKDGELLVRKDFKNGEEYRKENYFESYHDGHVLMSKGYYKNEKKDGIWEYYDNGGSLTLTEVYKEGELIEKEGELIE